MTSLFTSHKWFLTDLQKAAGMDSSNRKALALLLMLLLSHVACDAHTVAECCSQPSRSCRLYVLLCRSGNRGTLTGDAAAGILTLGKRLEDEHRLQSRLHQLLHGSKNQAAGILTMGKRTEEGVGEQESDWTMQAGNTITTSLPV
ncbi:hypocretin neuropeptide precursor [Sphaeramia orbicularis]|uniref:Hypocretin neuropeptide precursor n=1 Tax=Sphaeramia orbicularis TaxID=375764 RepID=A0A673BIV3_9TELE|nr:orexin [Sphaeramia orbicularis]